MMATAMARAAERVGFEPTDTRVSAVFKIDAPPLDPVALSVESDPEGVPVDP